MPGAAVGAPRGPKPLDNAARGFVELVAQGNVDVNGADFRALASRMTYSASKEQLILEGDGRRLAELYSSGRSDAKARKLTYSRRTGNVYIENVGSSTVDLNQQAPPRGRQR
jgi:lipopolysaccharide export system protein LptA